MSRSTLLAAAVLATCIGGVVAVADALVVTDEERIEAFVDALSGEINTAQIDDALAFVDTDRVPLTLRSERGTEVFDGGDFANVADRARTALRPLEGSDTTLIQEHISVSGDHAEVALRVRTDLGIVDANLRFEKVAERWLLSHAHIR